MTTTIKKNELDKLLGYHNQLHIEIERIIGIATSDSVIVSGLDLPWAFEEGSGMVYYARDKADSIYDYEGFQVSSLGSKGISGEFFMGESDGLTYLLGYAENDNWSNTYILILDNKNKESLTI